MKKHLLMFCFATLVAFVACDTEEKEKDGGGNETEEPIENPSDTVVAFNQFAAVQLPVVEQRAKNYQHYDAKTIYDNATAIRHDDGWSMGMLWFEYWYYRNEEKRQLAIKGIQVLHSPCEGCPYSLGSFPYSRNVVLEVRVHEDGSILDLTTQREYWRKGEEDQSFSEEFYSCIPDTAAYIPNAVMDSLQPLMEKAFAKGQESGNWKELFDLFDNGYKFIPVTGEEYRELARLGRN